MIEEYLCIHSEDVDYATADKVYKLNVCESMTRRTTHDYSLGGLLFGANWTPKKHLVTDSLFGKIEFVPMKLITSKDMFHYKMTGRLP